jgi:hypothetical protein
MGSIFCADDMTSVAIARLFFLAVRNKGQLVSTSSRWV